MTLPRLVCLVGPTASGKTDLALELAPVLGAEVVSADSRQVYRGLDVGTAKPTAAARALVPHHCVDLVEPEESFDAARFRAAATAAIADIHARGRVALVVGGTGLWVRALLHGLCPAPPRVPALRAVLAAVEPAALHRGLAAVDPTAAARIHPHDRVRLERALEVVLASGRPLSAWQAAHGFSEQPYAALVLGLALPAAELDARIAVRARAMVAGGLADEVRALCARGMAPDAPAWRAVGYREARAWLTGACAAEMAHDAIARATRRFAKRQRTWFRRDPEVVWRHPHRDRARLRDEVAAFLG